MSVPAETTYADFDFELARGSTAVLRVVCGDGRASLKTTGTPTAGNFTVKYPPDGPLAQESPAIAYDASAAAVAAVLGSLLAIPVGEVTCSGGPLPTAVVIEFVGTITGQDPRTIAVGTNSLTGGTNPRPEVNRKRQDITGWDLRFTAKESLRDTDAAAVLKLDNGALGGIAAEDLTNGQVLITITPALQANLEFRDYNLRCDLIGVDASDNQWTLAQGKLKIRARVTRTP